MQALISRQSSIVYGLKLDFIDCWSRLIFWSNYTWNYKLIHEFYVYMYVVSLTYDCRVTRGCICLWRVLETQPKVVIPMTLCLCINIFFWEPGPIIPLCRFSVGQNLAIGYGEWLHVVQAWFDEQANFTYGNKASNVFEDVGHYTQVCVRGTWLFTHFQQCWSKGSRSCSCFFLRFHKIWKLYMCVSLFLRYASTRSFEMSKLQPSFNHTYNTYTYNMNDNFP